MVFENLFAVYVTKEQIKFQRLCSEAGERRVP